MTLLSPWMLFAAAAAGIPLALHFFYRARYRPLPWAAMKFLRLSIEQTSRRLRFQEVLLLILRVTVLVVLALALARPSSLTGGGGGGRGENVDAILVIDTSYSMSARDGDKTRLDRAKDAALAVIDNLPPHSTAQVITFTCGDHAVHVGPRSPGNLDQARQLVQRLEVGHQGTDFLTGLNEAVAAFDRCTAAHKEVYLFSDMQKSGWERQAAAVRAKCEQIKDRATLFLVRCGERPAKDVAIVDVAPQGGIPHTGTRTTFTVLVRNGSSEAVRDVKVALEVDGKALTRDEQAIPAVGPGETKAVTLTGKLEEPGFRVLTARLNVPDDIDVDNRFDKVVLVRDRVRVLIVDGAPDDRDPEKSASYFVGHALRPVPENQWPVYHIQPRIVRASEASAALLSDKDVCILANVALGRGGLSEDFVKALAGFVRDGHGLVIGAGSNVSPADYNRLLGPGGAGLLPLELGEPFVASKERPLRLDPDSIDGLSFLGRFKEAPLNQIGKVEVAKLLQVKEPEAGDPGAGRVLLRAGDGRPVLADKVVGDGEVLLLTTALDPSWADWPIHPTFVPFMHGTLTHLMQRAATPYNRVAGEPIRWSPPEATREFVLVKPGGERVRLGRAQGGTGGQGLTLTAADTALSGVYQIVAEGETHGTRFALVPDLRESESLEALDDGQIDAQLGFKPAHLTAGSDPGTFSGNERSKREWTVWVLLAVLCVAFGETAWAWLCGRAW